MSIPSWLTLAARRFGVALTLGLATIGHAQAQAGAHDYDALQHRITDHIYEQIGDVSGDLQLQLDLDSLDRFAPCADPQITMPASPRLRPRLSVLLRCDAPQRWQTYVTVQLHWQGSYWVAAQTIEPGQAIGPDLLDARHGDLLSLPRGAVLEADQVLGQVATRRIAAGQILRENALRSAAAVQRGQTVRLVFRGRGFVATGEGQAIDSAPPGGQVQVRTASGQIVTGTVLADGTVDVGSP